MWHTQIINQIIHVTDYKRNYLQKIERETFPAKVSDYILNFEITQIYEQIDSFFE